MFKAASERLDMGIEAGLMAGRLVLVHDALGHGFVDGRNGFLERSSGCILVARFNRLQHFFDRCANKRTLAGVVLAMALRLTGSYAS